MSNDNNNNGNQPAPPQAANAVKPPNIIQGQCGHCSAPITVTLPPINVANMMDMSLAIVNHPKLITCKVCSNKLTLLCVGASMQFQLQPLGEDEAMVAIQQGMIDDSLIEVVQGASVFTALKGLKRPQ